MDEERILLYPSSPLFSRQVSVRSAEACQTDRRICEGVARVAHMSVCRHRRAAPDGGEESAVTSRRSRRPKRKQPRPLPPWSTLTSPHEFLESSEVPKDPPAILNFTSTCQHVKRRITSIPMEPVTAFQKPGSNLGKFGFGRENGDLDGSKKWRSLLPPLREVPTGLGKKESLAKIRTYFQLCETTPPDTRIVLSDENRYG